MKKTAITIVLSIALIALIIVLLRNRWFKKNILRQDNMLEHLLYSDFDARAESDPGVSPTYTRDGKKYITGSGYRNMDRNFVRLLDDVSSEFYKLTGHKLWKRIISGYRTEKRNKHVGGVADSAHLYGLAADISTVGLTQDERDLLIETAKKHGIHRIGVYTNSMHFDIQYSKPIVMW